MTLKQNIFENATILECRLLRLILASRIQVLDQMIDWLMVNTVKRSDILAYDLEREVLKAQLEQLESFNLDWLLDRKEEDLEKVLDKVSEM